jgi:hypothetical protein
MLGLATGLPLAEGDVVFHGSPSNVPILEARQPTWQDAKRRHYNDGQKSICASVQTAFPAMRSLLHEARPELQGAGWILSKRIDSKGRVHWFTSEEVLESLVDANGFVYGINKGKSGTAGATYDDERDEHRIMGDQVPIIKITVGTEDLPGMLHVISGDGFLQLSELPYYADPIAWSDAVGVDVRRIDGVWPTEYYPH